MSIIEETAFIAEAETAMAAGQLYRLVDPGAVPERQLHADALGKAGLVKNPLLAQTSAQRLYLWPLTHDITPELDLEHELAEEKAQRPESLLEPAPFCGWIFTQQARSTVAAYISRQLAQTTPEGKRALLRFYDPRVMSQLPRILHPSQLSALLGPIDRWVYLDRHGRLCCIEPHADKRHLGRLRLTTDQWQAIRRIGQINRCLQRCRSLPEQDRPAQVDDAERIDDLIVAAQAHGLYERADVTAFVLHGLTIHATFYEHPIMQRLLRNLAVESLGYIELTNRLAERDWETMATMKETS
ncbi:DUF4123 domain-containing protein [Chromohalobacter nigrandesensis]|uniref:DUF4123 domain-containing protein n=1 Tax=Chromohalobacter nigrandesensis TaxID=119863 RepID=UPI001FF48055|nr:DUF4123 domain-containing protein [Chromohalobacter nigrandesensis]MCK0746814.1 DUF4123 domain-containing protein [Chromohalobacter nigrandesensis]